VADIPRIAFSQKSVRTGEQPISYLLKQAVANRNMISLAAGLVDHETLPHEAVREAAGEILGDPETGRRALQYGTIRGDDRLRGLMLEHLGRLEGVDPSRLGLGSEHVVVTSGSQQLLYLVSDMLVDPGDIVIVSAPSYFVYLGTLENLGARAVSIPMDADGMRTDLLEERLEQLEREGLLPRVKLIYVVSYFQNPTGLTLSAERRPELVRIAQRFSRDHRILVLEDAAYRELCYEGAVPPSVKRHDPANEWVVLAQTFSKPFSPGLKTGIGFLPDELVEPLDQQKGNHDFGSANFNQHLLAHAMASGRYAQQVQALVRQYRTKLTAMLDGLEAALGDLRPEVDWTRPRGGLYVWVTAPEGVDTGPDGELLACCLERGVLYVPGQYCYGPAEPGAAVPTHHMRLSFGVQSPENIQEGLHRLADALRECPPVRS